MTPVFPNVSCFYIGLLGILHLALWINIINVRRARDNPSEFLKLQNLAKNKDYDNLSVTRAYGNFTENAPIFAIMSITAEMCNSPSHLVEATAFTFILSRLIHAAGLIRMETRDNQLGRIVGALGTQFSLLSSAMQCCWYSGFADLQRILALLGALVLVHMLAR